MIRTNVILAGLLGAWCCAVGAATPPPTKPNLVVIMADDLGYGDVSCNGATAVKTPHVDKLAADGLRFTSGYCSASTCTPTRYSFLTGTYAFRESRTGIAGPNSPSIIPPGTVTVASLLKRAGYATAIVGKWHLGLGQRAPNWNGDLKPGPLELGFDYCFLLPTTNDRVPQVYVENHRVRNLDPADPLWVGKKKPARNHPTGVSNRGRLRMDWSHEHNGTIHNGISRLGFYTGGQKARYRDEDLADEWVKQSVRWMEKHKDQPFFLFFASHDIHVPRMPHERFQGKTRLGYRGDAIVEFDWSVGELMKALDRLGVADNTLVVICSDNGPVLDDGYKDGAVAKRGNHKSAGPYRGGKYSVFEGGTRTPFITHWKGRIKPGVSDEIVCTVDLAASFAALVGQPLPDTACRDSFNVMDALLGVPGAKGRDHVLQQNNHGNNKGLRQGHWKLVQSGGSGKEQLFNLAKDPDESTNLAKREPEQLNRLRALLRKIVQDGHSRPGQEAR
jgi:arylsulfatase A